MRNSENNSLCTHQDATNKPINMQDSLKYDKGRPGLTFSLQ